MRGFLKWSNFEWFGGIPILGNLHILGYNRNSSKAAKGAQVWIEFGVLHSFYPFHQDAWINLTWNNTPENNKIIMVFHFSKDMNAKVPVQCIIFGIDGIMGLEIGDMSGFKYAWAWMFQDVQVQVQARHYHLKSNANQKLITICPDQNEQVMAGYWAMTATWSAKPNSPGSAPSTPLLERRRIPFCETALWSGSKPSYLIWWAKNVKWTQNRINVYQTAKQNPKISAACSTQGALDRHTVMSHVKQNAKKSCCDI